MKSILPHVQREQWEAATREALRIHDAIVGEAPVQQTAQAPAAAPSQSPDEYTLTARISKLQAEESNGVHKVYCVLADERAGVNHHGSAWRADGQAMERFSIGEEIEVNVKEVHKNGKVFKNFSRPRRPAPGSFDDSAIPF
tara:strand:+ start:4962 stop:5384 length:423 start_codon:yes stop_codon:yes gene_type:complete